jgi:hypothetical protein
MLRGLGWACALFVGLLLTGALVDRIVPMPRTVRAAWLAMTATLSLLPLVRPLLRLWHAVDWVAAAATVERRDPRFGQRLLTLVSRMTGRTEHRGSTEFLDELAFGLERDAGDKHPARLLPLSAIATPWLLLALLAVFVLALLQSADLKLPQLGRRMLLPWVATPAATTTQVTVTPGDMNVPQGASAKIDATISRLRGSAVWLNFAEGNDEEWQRVAMSLADDATAPSSSPGTEPALSRYSYTIPSVDRDVRYFVSAGDATSSSYELRVLRRPAIAEFRFAFTFPGYAGKPPATMNNRDGRIEVPTGTEVQLTIVCTEPLQSALLTVSGEKQLMSPVAGDADGRLRQGHFTVSGNGRYDIDLITTRQQTGTAPATAEIRAIPDRSPTVRISGAKNIVRLGPGDVLPLGLEVSDDFGIDTLTCKVTSSAGPVEFPVWPRVAGAGGSAFDFVHGDRRRLDGLFELDLALLSLVPGDVASVTLVARDSGNHSKESDPLTLLVTRGTASPLIYEHAAELRAASKWAAGAADDLEQALKALGEPTGTEPAGNASARSAAALRSGRNLRSAADGLALVRRALMRALARSPSAELNGALEAWIDQAATAARIAELLSRNGAPDSRPGDPKRPATAPTVSNSAAIPIADQRRGCQQALDQAHQLRDVLKTVANAATATTVLADLQNLADAEQRRNGQQVQPIRKDISDACKAMGLSDRNGDPAKLKELQDRGRSAARAQSKLDLRSAIAQWAESPEQIAFPPPMVGERLLTQARAHAERPDSDVQFAADLNLSGIAAIEIAATGNGDALHDFSNAFKILSIEHQSRRPDPASVAVRLVLAPPAEAARSRMREWDAGKAPSTPSLRAGRIEAIALSAAAATARHDYVKAAAFDSQLQKLAASQPESAIGAVAQQALDRCALATDAAARTNGIISRLSDADAADHTIYRAAADEIAEVAARTAPVGAGRLVAIAGGNPRDRRGAAINASRCRFLDPPIDLLPLKISRAAVDAADAVLAANDPLTDAKWLARGAFDSPNLKEKPAIVAALRTAEFRLQRFATLQRLLAVRTIRPFSSTSENTTEPTRVPGTPRSTPRPAFSGMGNDDGMPTGNEGADEGFNDPEAPGFEAAIRAYREAVKKK